MVLKEMSYKNPGSGLRGISIMMMEEKKKNRKKSIFKLSEELHQRLQKQKHDRTNSLTATSAKSWLARRLIQNAIFGRTGNLGRAPHVK